MKKYLILLLLVSANSFASEICDRVSSGLTSYLEQGSSRIAFRNQGGLIGGGVCWWHSRLQRASALLAEFSPEKPKPTAAEASRIIQTLRNMNKIVVIPGYADFYSFSRAYHKQIQAMLENWQITDGMFNQEWIRGISGKSELPPEQMKKRMDTLFDQFTQSPQPVWVMAQIKGITSHSFLLTEMAQTGSGYELKMIDSNEPSKTKVYQYNVGQRALRYSFDTYSFVPYLGFQKDFLLMKKAVEAKCGKIMGLDEFIPMGEVERK